MQKFKLDAISGNYGHHCQELARRPASYGSYVSRIVSGSMLDQQGGKPWSPYLHRAAIWSPELYLGQTDQRADRSSSVKNLVGSLTFSDSGYGRQGIRPYATWPQVSPAILPRGATHCKGFSLILLKVLDMECLFRDF